MKLAELLTTAKGRKATAKLATDITKVTGKVATVGTAGLAGALVNAAVSVPVSRDEEENSNVQYGWTAEDLGGSPRAEDPEWN
ncbi:hypothetical protein MHM84_18700 [Halomonas sp. McH1-25]|uniref:hypothetical protein n=1 Tax=unclassified Halomonas TaxID=2609666 RepID=UPI001EF70203|nr:MULTISPECIES: hypothetical protein [unclassified Halomonas]MCG7601797.1 hypothetical protein [Halomonas sp. McH1-25]MCP1343973.1 hypothetical protein [Halomonas sp. FL8]MCP1361794.1 hypothetical protein [Halomonas sp. BBD45]MCP1364938.1 hypothetical protein [Halomonas sp. BBD48]